MLRNRRPSSDASRSARRRAGFTLIEAALTTVIVGTGVLAIVAAQQAYHQKNGWAARTATAQMLANELRERTMILPLQDPQLGCRTGCGPEASEDEVLEFDDLDDFSGSTGAGITIGTPTLAVLGGSDTSAATIAALDSTALATLPVAGADKLPGPVNALGQIVDGLPGWSQHINVSSVSSDYINAPFTLPLGSTDVMRVDVKVYFQGPNQNTAEVVTELNWIVTR